MVIMKTGIMKTTIIFCVIFLSSLFAEAQAQNKNGNDTLDKRYARIVTFKEMDQRKIYHWGNGQQCTATGREAGEHLPDYVKLIGNDSAVVVEDPKGAPLR